MKHVLLLFIGPCLADIGGSYMRYTLVNHSLPGHQHMTDFIVGVGSYDPATIFSFDFTNLEVMLNGESVS